MATKQPFWDGTGGLGDVAWETCWLGAHYIPGLVTIQWKKAPKRRIEKKPVKGKDGTRVTDQGDELAELAIRTEIYTASQWEEFQDVIPLIWTSKDGGERTPLELLHPLPNAMGIHDVYVESIIPHHPTNQIMLVEIQVFQWKPNPVVITKAAGRGDPAVKANGKGARLPTSEEVFSPIASAGKAVGNLLGNLGSYF